MKQYGVVILALSIVFSGWWLGNSIKQMQLKNEQPKEILTLTEAADYLGISEDSIKKIITQESSHLNNTGSFSGKMFPYSKVYGHYLFSRKSLDEWMKKSAESQSVYSENGLLRNN